MNKINPEDTLLYKFIYDFWAILFLSIIFGCFGIHPVVAVFIYYLHKYSKKYEDQQKQNKK